MSLDDEPLYGINPFSRENKGIWLSNQSTRTRYLCLKCRRAQHSKGFDYPCEKECECLCKTHYIARDGLTKIPYGVMDHTKADEDDLPPPSEEFKKLMGTWKDKKLAAKKPQEQA